MNYVERTQYWLEIHRERLTALGKLIVAMAPGDRPQRSIHVAIDREDRFCEIIVWESGEAEFAFGRPSSPSEEHHDLVDISELDILLDRMLARAAD